MKLNNRANKYGRAMVKLEMGLIETSVKLLATQGCVFGELAVYVCNMTLLWQSLCRILTITLQIYDTPKRHKSFIKASLNAGYAVVPSGNAVAFQRLAPDA